MRIKKWLAVLAALLMALSLAACGNKNNEEDTLSAGEYLPDITPPLNVAITDCLSADAVSAIIGVPMTASEPYEEGTWVVYSSQDGTHSVSVSMENTTTVLYDAMVADLSGSEQEQALGERAYWYEQTEELINYCNGYAIAVRVSDLTVMNTKGLCQAVMKKITDNLQAK